MSKNNGNLDQNVLKVLLESVKQQNDLLVQILQSQKETSQKETSQKETSQKETSQKEIEKIKIISQDQSMKARHLCQAISKTTGKQCKLTTLDSSKFCHVHSKNHDPNHDHNLDEKIKILDLENEIKILGSSENKDPERLRLNNDKKAINFLFSAKRRGFPQVTLEKDYLRKELYFMDLNEKRDFIGNRSVKPLIKILSWKNGIKVSNDNTFKIGEREFKIVWQTKKYAKENDQQYFRQYIERIA